jgi:hypothetical protein
MRFYLQYLSSGGYRRLQGEFGCGELRGFRVLFITSSPKRLENIRQRCGAIPFEPTVAKRFIWLATQTVLKDEHLLEHEWCSLDPSDPSLYTIAPHLQS